MTFGEKLKKLRIEKQLSQEDLANQLGVSRQAISKWEQDIALPDTNNLILIAKIFLPWYKIGSFFNFMSHY